MFSNERKILIYNTIKIKKRKKLVKIIKLIPKSETYFKS